MLIIHTMLSLSLMLTLSLLMQAECKAADRTQAEWIESLGGKSVTDDAGNVTSIDLRHSWLTDADLKRVGQMHQLRKIQLGYTKVTDQGLEYLASLEHVEHLDLYFAESIGDAGMVHLKPWRKLKSLNMRGTKVTSTLLDHLVGMSELESLDVGFSRVNDDNFERLGELPKLRRLAIGGNKMSGVALPLLKLIPTLRELELNGQQRTDSGLWSVALTDANCGVLATLTNLESLDLADTAISDRGLQRLSSLTNLRRLRLSRTKISEKGLAALVDLPRLTELNCAGVEGVSDAALPVVGRMPALEVLHLEGTKVTVQGLLESSAPPKLERLIYSQTGVSPFAPRK